MAKSQVVRLQAGETALVVAQDPSLEIGGGPMPGYGDRPVDPGYGIDLGLGLVDPGWSGGVAPPGEEGGAPHPDQGLPGSQPHPDNTLPGSQPHPDNELPPVGETPPPVDPGSTPGWEIKVAWTPVTGWVIVAVPTGDHISPSKAKKK